MEQSALIIVDVQNDFCPGGALAITNGDRVVQPLNKAIDLFDRYNMPVLLTRDWHPEKTVHFDKYGGKWPVHCVQNTPGAELHPKLICPPWAPIISKGMNNSDDGYSGFEGTCLMHLLGTPLTGFYGKRLDGILSDLKVINIYVGGLATDYCVKATCLDGRRLHYNVFLLTDACQAVNLRPSDGAEAMEEMKRAGVRFITTDEFFR